jgi:hypothetical protein
LFTIPRTSWPQLSIDFQSLFSSSFWVSAVRIWIPRSLVQLAGSYAVTLLEQLADLAEARSNLIADVLDPLHRIVRGDGLVHRHPDHFFFCQVMFGAVVAKDNTRGP